MLAGGAVGTIGAGLPGSGDTRSSEGDGGEGAIVLRCSLWTGGGARKFLSRGLTTHSGEAGVDAELSEPEPGVAAANLEAEGG